MPATIDDLLLAFSKEMQYTIHRYTPFVKKAEDEGYPQLAKLFRAIVASDTARGNLFRTGMASHAREAHDYYVCPHCGLVFIPEAPDKCPVDDTLGTQFERIN
jgi:rubrerythrin